MPTLQKMSAVMFAAAAISLVSVGQAQAAQITVTSVSTTMGTNPGSDLNNIINGSGMTASGLRHARSNAANSWLSALGQTTGEIIFNFGSQYKLTDIKIWNYIGPNRLHGVKEVQFKTDQGGGFVPLTFNPSGINLIPDAVGTTSPVSSVFSVPNVFAHSVKFIIDSNHGRFDHTGLSEVQFFGTPNAAIPTPALLPGLVGLGMAAARKRRAKCKMVAA